MVREEYTDQFGNAAITAHGRANVRKRHLTAKISHHPGNAGVLLVNSVLVGDVPDVQAQVLHVAELNTSLVLREDLDDIVQDRGLLILKGRVVFGDKTHAALLISNDQRMHKVGRSRRINPDLREDRLLDLHALWNVEEDAATPEGCVEGSVLIALNWHALRHKVLLHQCWIFTNGGIQVRQDDALALQLLVKFDMYDRGIALHYVSRALIDEGILQGLLDDGWKCAAAVGRDIGADFLVFEICHGPKCAQVAAASERRRSALKDIPGVEALLEHPCGLSLLTRQLFHRVTGQPPR